MSLKLKRRVKREILDYKRFIKDEDVTTFARSRFSKRLTKPISRSELRKVIELVNARLNEVFEELKPKARQTAFEVLGEDEKLMNRFVKRDRFNQTFSDKFQMSRKRVRRVIKKRVTELYDKTNGEVTADELIDKAQETWSNTAEFIKFIAYLVADAFNFATFDEIDEASTSGKFEIYLSENHEHNDICNRKVGIFDLGDEVDLPPFHPYCVCSVRAV